jgi:hypothetical protein
MLFHLSIAAQDPRHVAEVFAEIWGGEALPFPPVAKGSWVAMAGDDRGTSIEIYPAGTVLSPEDGPSNLYDAKGETGRLTPTHAAIATRLDQAQVLAIAAREGWQANYYKRGGMFGVIELWVEGRQMFEVLTPEMQAEYLACTADLGKLKAAFSGPPAGV